MKNRIFVSFVFLLGLIAGFIALVLVNRLGASADPLEKDIISAEIFELKGENGKTYARLGTHNSPGILEHDPYLVFLDENGKEKMELKLAGGNPVIELNNPSGNSSIELSLGPYKDESNLIIKDKNGTLQLGTWNYSNELSYLNLTFWDQKDNARMRISLGEKGNPVLQMFDSTGFAGVRIAVESDEQGRIFLLDQKGKVVWKAK